MEGNRALFRKIHAENLMHKFGYAQILYMNPIHVISPIEGVLSKKTRDMTWQAKELFGKTLNFGPGPPGGNIECDRVPLQTKRIDADTGQ